MIKLADGIWIKDTGNQAGHVYSAETGGTYYGHIAYVSKPEILAAWRMWLRR